MYADLMWLQLEDRSLELIWQINVDLVDHWFDASISAVNGETLQVHDFVHYNSYQVSLDKRCCLATMETTLKLSNEFTDNCCFSVVSIVTNVEPKHVDFFLIGWNGGVCSGA